MKSRIHTLPLVGLLALSFSFVACGERTENAPSAGNAVKSSEHAGNYSVVTDDNFAAFTKTDGIAVVDFWATWCGPCKTMAPIFADVSESYDGAVAFGKLDVDDSPSSASQMGIRSIPTIVIFKDGKAVDKVVGVVTAEKLKARIDRYL